MTHVAIGGKGSKWVYNTNVKMDYRFKSKDKILIEYNKLKRTVWFYLNGCLVADALLQPGIKYRFGAWI